jgi:pimeloyl-[acyl-carrier protein] methyl ester esterase
VLLHGWGFHSQVWSPCQAALADRYRVTAIDLPGHGRSIGAAPDDLQGWVERLCQQLPAAVWVGWSLGGLVSLAAAQTVPSKVRRVIAVASSPRFVRAPDWPHAVAREVLDAFADELERDYRKTLTRFLALQLRGDDAGRAELRRLRELMFAHPPSPDGLRAGLRILREADLRMDRPAPACPVRYILGERDALVPVEVVSDLGAARVSVIEGAGHAPFVSHLSRFLDALNEALDV